MPIDDACLLEKDALIAKWIEAEEMCNLALAALMDWAEARINAWDHCSYLGILGGGLSEHIDEFGWREALEKEIEECISLEPDVVDAWSVYQDLELACEIARDEAKALQEAYEACLHDLNDSMTFE